MSSTDVDAISQGRIGDWEITARNGVKISISWIADDTGSSVVCTINDHTEKEAPEQQVELGFIYPKPRTASVQLPSLEITLILHAEGNQAELICNLPLTYNEFFNGPIGEWCLAYNPINPDNPSDPSTPDADIIIESPQNKMDLSPFIWLHPPTLRELEDKLFRFVRLQKPDTLPLYVTLEKSESASDKTAAATTFQASDNYVSKVSTLAPPINKLPVIRLQLIEELKGDQSLDEITTLTEKLLGETIDDFLLSSQWTQSESSVWQSLFTIALIGSHSDSTLADQFIDILRVGHFLTLLEKKLPELEIQTTRNLALSGIVSLPDAVATTTLNEKAKAAGGEKENQGSWKLLGLGTLKHARQQLKGYQAGELAEVVNVMPCERQERQEHLLTQQEQHQRSDEAHHEETDNSRQSTSANDLTKALQEVMAAEGLARNMSNVTPSYENLNQMLTGSWTGGNANAGWSDMDSSRLVQTLTEKAASHLGDQVTSQRGKVWQELCERRQSNLIDNRGNQRLVGIYRWVDKLVQVDLTDAGRRLILSITLENPAETWISNVKSLGDKPLVKPQPLSAFSVANGQGYANILPTNYQAYAAQYGITDIEAPPADTQTVTATINRVVVGDLSTLVIPEGYRANTGNVTTAIANSQYNLVCSIAGQDISYPAQVIAPSDLTVIAPDTSSTTSVGNAVVTPAAPSSALLSTVALSNINNMQGAIPITVMSSASLFGVTVEVSCTRGVSSSEDPLLVSWQMDCYNRLYQAWEEALDQYNKALKTRIELASKGRTTEIQRDVLTQGCLTLLQPTSTSECTLEPLFSWFDMSWHYESKLLDMAPTCPPVSTSSISHPEPEQLFTRFLQAPAAHILLPVQPGSELQFLFDLQFPSPWVGSRSRTPITESTLWLIEELIGPEPDSPNINSGVQNNAEQWTIRLPTSMLYLQQGPTLPQQPNSSSEQIINPTQMGETEQEVAVLK